MISEIDFDQVPSTGGSRKDQKSRFVQRTMMYTNGLEIKCLVNDRLEQKPKVLEPGGSLTDLAKKVKKKSKLLPLNELPIDVSHIKSNRNRYWRKVCCWLLYETCKWIPKSG